MLTFLKYDSISQSTKRKYVKIRARRGLVLLSCKYDGHINALR